MKLEIVNSKSGRSVILEVENVAEAGERAEAHAEKVKWVGHDYILTDETGQRWVNEMGAWTEYENSYLAE